VAPDDGRVRLLQLTAKGRTAFARLDSRAQDATLTLLDAHGEQVQQDIVHHMQALLRLLSPDPKPAPAILLRPPKPGDLGWVVHRQAILYAQEYGWDSSYETLIADIVGKFKSGPGEQCWIAELDGAPAGAVFIVRENDAVARLRLLHVEPFARGNGLGRVLVDACVGFARGAGYKTLRLWTNDVLVSARRIYQAAGFTLVKEEKHHSFGKDLVGQTWELVL
jgi:GNAT superfamily N-acetyltransferase